MFFTIYAPRAQVGPNGSGPLLQERWTARAHPSAASARHLALLICKRSRCERSKQVCENPRLRQDRLTLNRNNSYSVRMQEFPVYWTLIRCSRYVFPVLSAIGIFQISLLAPTVRQVVAFGSMQIYEISVIFPVLFVGKTGHASQRTHRHKFLLSALVRDHLAVVRQ